MKHEILMALGAILILAFAAGCTQSPSAAANGAQPNTTSVGQTQTQAGAGQIQNQPSPADSAGNSCSSMAGDARIACVYEQAKASNDVTICTALQAQDDRFKCIAQWCGSEMRDYRQCGRLANYDDNLGCMNKCNPNPNT